jgi:hypothetical protein
MRVETVRGLLVSHKHRTATKEGHLVIFFLEDTTGFRSVIVTIYL